VRPAESGVTFIEILTMLVAMVVVAAVAIPLWRTHELRSQRREAMDALLAIQSAQDRHFGRHARYAEAPELDLQPAPPHYTLAVERGADQLSYVARARVRRLPGITFDARCAELGVDQHGRRFAVNESGEDSTADCWERK
jgi:type IV pilus assembly protein PilE